MKLEDNFGQLDSFIISTTWYRKLVTVVAKLLHPFQGKCLSLHPVSENFFQLKSNLFMAS